MKTSNQGPLTMPRRKPNVGQLPKNRGPATMQTTTRETFAKKPANGTTDAKAAPEAATTDAKAAPEAAPDTTAPEQAAKPTRRGIVPTMPAAVFYAHEGRVFASLQHPSTDGRVVESGKGIGSATGALVDSGYTLGQLTTDGPEWLQEKGRIPEGAEVIGYAAVKGFPLPL